MSTESFYAFRCLFGRSARPACHHSGSFFIQNHSCFIYKSLVLCYDLFVHLNPFLFLYAADAIRIILASVAPSMLLRGSLFFAVLPQIVARWCPWCSAIILRPLGCADVIPFAFDFGGSFAGIIQKRRQAARGCFCLGICCLFHSRQHKARLWCAFVFLFMVDYPQK